MLKEKLEQKGFEVEVADFPQYNTKSAGLVEEYLSGKYGTDTEVGPKIASIFYAADRYDASFKIRKWLEQGKIVLANRYVSSNMGHQGGKIEDSTERKQFFDWEYDLEYNLFKIPKPDLSILLHIPHEVAQELAKKRNREDWEGKTKDIHEENLEHLRRASETYKEISKFPGFTMIDCVENGELQTPDQIHEKVWLQAGPLFNN